LTRRILPSVIGGPGGCFWFGATAEGYHTASPRSQYVGRLGRPPRREITAILFGRLKRRLRSWRGAKTSSFFCGPRPRRGSMTGDEVDAVLRGVYFF
jgi:hypothetical protein